MNPDIPILSVPLPDFPDDAVDDDVYVHISTEPKMGKLKYKGPGKVHVKVQPVRKCVLPVPLPRMVDAPLNNNNVLYIFTLKKSELAKIRKLNRSTRNGETISQAFEQWLARQKHRGEKSIE